MAGISFANIDISTMFNGIGTLLKDIRAAITGKEPIDAAKAAEIELKLVELEQQANNAQTKINEVEAASSKMFVAGWRPAAGWTCVLGLLYSVFIRPMISWFASIWHFSAVPPVIDNVMLMQILFGMLGLGAIRTYEKINNVK